MMPKFAPGSTIFLIFLLLMPSLGFPADLPAGVATAPVAHEICFPLQDGERILRDLESLPPCLDAVKAAEDSINSSEARSKELEIRIVEQDRELKDARKLVDDTRKAGEDAVKVAGGSWYTRALSVVKWVALGIVLGYAGGMSK
jgi:hypothetical protein